MFRAARVHYRPSFGRSTGSTRFSAAAGRGTGSGGGSFDPEWDAPLSGSETSFGLVSTPQEHGGHLAASTQLSASHHPRVDESRSRSSARGGDSRDRRGSGRVGGSSDSAPRRDRRDDRRVRSSPPRGSSATGSHGRRGTGISFHRDRKDFFSPSSSSHSASLNRAQEGTMMSSTSTAQQQEFSSDQLEAWRMAGWSWNYETQSWEHSGSSFSEHDASAVASTSSSSSSSSEYQASGWTPTALLELNSTFTWRFKEFRLRETIDCLIALDQLSLLPPSSYPHVVAKLRDSMIVASGTFPFLFPTLKQYVSLYNLYGSKGWLGIKIERSQSGQGDLKGLLDATATSLAKSLQSSLILLETATATTSYPASSPSSSSFSCRHRDPLVSLEELALTLMEGAKVTKKLASSHLSAESAGILALRLRKDLDELVHLLFHWNSVNYAVDVVAKEVLQIFNNDAPWTSEVSAALSRTERESADGVSQSMAVISYVQKLAAEYAKGDGDPHETEKKKYHHRSVVLPSPSQQEEKPTTSLDRIMSIIDETKKERSATTYIEDMEEEDDTAIGERLGGEKVVVKNSSPLIGQQGGAAAVGSALDLPPPPLPTTMGTQEANSSEDSVIQPPEPAVEALKPQLATSPQTSGDISTSTSTTQNNRSSSSLTPPKSCAYRPAASAYQRDHQFIAKMKDHSSRGLLSFGAFDEAVSLSKELKKLPVLLHTGNDLHTHHVLVIEALLCLLPSLLEARSTSDKFLTVETRLEIIESLFACLIHRLYERDPTSSSPGGEGQDETDLVFMECFLKVAAKEDAPIALPTTSGNFREEGNTSSYYGSETSSSTRKKSGGSRMDRLASLLVQFLDKKNLSLTSAATPPLPAVTEKLQEPTTRLLQLVQCCLAELFEERASTRHTLSSEEFEHYLRFGTNIQHLGSFFSSSEYTSVESQGAGGGKALNFQTISSDSLASQISRLIADEKRSFFNAKKPTRLALAADILHEAAYCSNGGLLPSNELQRLAYFFFTGFQTSKRMSNHRYHQREGTGTLREDEAPFALARDSKALLKGAHAILSIGVAAIPGGRDATTRSRVLDQLRRALFSRITHWSTLHAFELPLDDNEVKRLLLTVNLLISKYPATVSKERKVVAETRTALQELQAIVEVSASGDKEKNSLMAVNDSSKRSDLADVLARIESSWLEVCPPAHSGSGNSSPAPDVIVEPKLKEILEKNGSQRQTLVA